LTEDDKDILHGGWCYLRRNEGPFIVGEDFDAPGPAARILPRIRIDVETWDKLWSFVASAKDERSNASAPLRLLEFRNGISEALDWYVSDCDFQPNIPAFRKQLHELARAVNLFKSSIPTETSSLGHFLSNTYTGEAALRDRLRPSRRQLIVLKSDWQKRAGFEAIDGTLNVMLRNIEAAHALLGKRKPRQHRVKALVLSLASVWKKATGRWPKSGRNSIDSRQSGPFAKFVRTTTSVLPKPFRIVSLDAAIRAACKRSDD
jgi:hypothetical protein